MNILIIYDSLFGNTEKLAKEMAVVARDYGAVSIKKIGGVIENDLKDVEVLILGSPTHGGRAKPSTQTFLDDLSGNSLAGIKFAVFDTRVIVEELNFALKLLVNTIGYAAPKMAAFLEKKGGKKIVLAEGFYVLGKEGPLKDGEVERAKAWIKKIFDN